MHGCSGLITLDLALLSKVKDVRVGETITVLRRGGGPGSSPKAQVASWGPGGVASGVGASASLWEGLHKLADGLLIEGVATAHWAVAGKSEGWG